MSDFHSYVYSRSAATRILGTEVVNTVADGQSPIIWCWLPKGQKALSVPKAKFKEHFAEYRRQLGTQITDVKRINSYVYQVKQKYSVSVFPVGRRPSRRHRVSCTCNDYATQQELGIKRGCCKHGYAVLKTLGCTSLAEFVEKQKTSPTPTKTRGNINQSLMMKGKMVKIKERQSPMTERNATWSPYRSFAWMEELSPELN